MLADGSDVTRDTSRPSEIPIVIHFNKVHLYHGLPHSIDDSALSVQLEKDVPANDGRVVTPQLGPFARLPKTMS